ncbi:sodium/hydrogen exchanger 3 isoform X13 [Drosophila erecta]|uniref:sodium/hydrogen exchanger 3 isoform X13 n=1 Tax=Drosophila erecta TaxID=7220 RepID=UPI000F0511E0|nr:sodium/hydrogen exchanger 3 isoform X13 [Drosophila erecta]
MSIRTEQDYDSATPALQREMNLARRACWRINSFSSEYLFKTIASVLTDTDAEAPPPPPPRDETKSRIGPQTAPANRNTSCTSSNWRGMFSKRTLLICALALILGIAQARPNMSAVGVAPGKVSQDIVDAVTQLNLGHSAPMDAVDVGVDPTPPATLPRAEPLKSVDQDAEGGEGHKMERYPLSSVDFARVKTPFIIGIWILSASIAKIGFHMTPKLHLIFPESCLLIVVGVVIGVVLYFCTDVAVSPLTPNTFFFYMLPPIILDAGYFMPNRLFFDNLGTILLMAVVGTIFNIATIGGSLYACGKMGIYGESETPGLMDVFLFASLISAVDPVAVLAVFEEIHVNEILYIVVFGESLLNDAVTVVMYHMMESYNEIGLDKIIAQDIASGVGSFFVVALGGTAIGIIWGFLTGLVTRFTDHVRVIEPIFIFVMAYLAYLNAEIFHMSGILAITFCGITMKNYVESNISQKSHTTVKYALKMLSSSAETIIFMFLGVATVNNMHVWNTWFVVLTIAFCSVFRVIGVILLSALANRFRLHKLSRVDQFVMSYGGLRGAVAFALVLLVDENVVKQKNMFVTTTIAVIYFTVFLQGITIKPLVKILNVKRANKRKPTMNERIHERFMDHLMAGIEDIVGKTGNYNVRDKFKRFDNRFIRPLLIRDLKGAEPKIIETYSKLTMRDAMEVMRRNPSTIGQMTGTESMSALFRNYTNNYIGGSPSLTNLDNTCSRNLDMAELDYNPSKKDLTDARIHHLLAEELKPYRRHRRLSYSRHAVDDRDLSTQVNYKMQMNFRRMFNDRKHHKRSKRGASNKAKENVKQNHVSFHDFQQNGTTKQLTNDYINNVLNETAEECQQNPNEINVVGPSDDWDDGLTFTAKSSLAEHPIPEEDRNLSRESDGERRVATPTATESQLPWKRQGDECTDAVQQNEFPAWASNKEYLAYNSPSATFLGGINKPKQPKSVIGLFRRESSSSKAGSVGIGSTGAMDSAASGSETMVVPMSSQPPNAPSTSMHNPRLDKRSQSISSSSLGAGAHQLGPDSHSGPFPVTASHRRNVRRGSMLELSGLIATGRRPSRILQFSTGATNLLGSAMTTSPSPPPPTISTTTTTTRTTTTTTTIKPTSTSTTKNNTTNNSTDTSASATHSTPTSSKSEDSAPYTYHTKDTIPEESSYQHGHSKSLCEPADSDEWEGAALAAAGGANSELLMRMSGREPLLPRPSNTPRAQIRRMNAGAVVGGAGVSHAGRKNQVTKALLDYEDSETDSDENDDDEDEDFDSYDDENIVVTTFTTPASGRRSGSSPGSGSEANTATTTTSIRLTRNNDESII